jgi:hypothetical protein
LTIAGFYLCPEGIVLGADSTSSVPVDNGLHYFDFNQKVFEIGEAGTLGMLTWGLGSLWPTSYRTLLALLADDLAARPAATVAEVAERWTDMFWNEYQATTIFQRYATLHAKPPHDPTANPLLPDARSAQEEVEYANLQSGLVVGFCIGGYVLPNRTPQAAHVLFDPLAGKPAVTVMLPESWQWWGVPNIVDRLIVGADSNLVNAIMSSGMWNGTHGDLMTLIQQQRLTHGTLPIRDAIDYVHSCIQCTIKAMKFSNMSQICGGPIEIAVITSDRKFRWVRHKPWDAAITDGGL